MAEIFGTVAGALSVAALFNNCVECFEYVQLGRHLGEDYERCQLKIDIAQTRLSRWGQAVAIHENSRFATTSPADALTQQVWSILEEIQLLFQSVQKTSKRYEFGKEQGDLVLFQDVEMQPVSRRIHGHLGTMVRQRQKQTSLAKKAAWALYEGKNFHKLIEEIKGFVDDLEKIWPVEVTGRWLAQLEIEAIEDEPGLTAVSEAAVDIDSVLAETATHKVEAIAVRNHVRKIGTQEKARVRVGNEFAAEILSRSVGFADQTTNTADIVDAKGESAVHMGNSYGRSIFD